MVASLIERYTNEMVELVESKLGDLFDAPIEIALYELVNACIAAHAVNPKLHKVLDEEVPRIGRLKQVANAEEKINALLRAYLERKRDRIIPQNLDLAVFILGRTVEALTHAERDRTSIARRWTARARNYRSFVVLFGRQRIKLQTLAGDGTYTLSPDYFLSCGKG